MASAPAVTSVGGLAPRGGSGLWTASRSGVLRLWDTASAEASPLWEVRLPGLEVVSFQLCAGEGKARKGGEEAAAVPGVGACTYAWVSYKSRKGRGRVAVFDLGQQERLWNAKVAKTDSPLELSASGDLSHCTAVERHTVLVWVAARHDKKPCTLHHTKPLRCAALSYNGDSLAAGDAVGQVLVWHGMRSACQKGLGGGNRHLEVPCSTFHWHAHPVGGLAFGREGDYLYSGGREGVLVVWQTRTGQRQFFPRVGAPIEHLAAASDGSHLAVRCENNSVHVLDLAARRVTGSLCGVKPGAARRAPGVPWTRSAVHPGTGAVVLSEARGGLQFYDVAQDAEMGVLQVVPQGHHMSDHHIATGGGAYRRDVRLFALSAGGESLATLDEFGFHSNLKFWASDAAAPLRYSEEAVVRRPHDAQVTALAFHPGDSEVLASVASDGSLKIWKGGSSKRLKKTDGSPGGRQWLCLLEADVSKGALSSLAFSGCGTVLALGGQGAVVLWDFEQSRELGLLRGGDEGVAFWKLLFCAADSTLVGLQPNSVVVWDLETRCVRHAFRLPAMAACAVDGTVFLATPSSALVGATPAPAVAPPTPTKKDKKKKDKKKKTDEGEAPEAGTPSQGTCVLSIAAGEPRAVAWLQDAVVDVFSRHGSGAKGAQGLIFATEDRRFLTLTS